MSEFNPDQYLAQKAGVTTSNAAPSTIEMNQFDPDQYLNQKASTQYDAIQSQYGTTGQEVIAGLEGGARGATLGLSDLAETKLGLTTPEALASRQTANPTISGLSNLVGSAGLIAATGGAGALAEGAGTAAKIGATALEGGAFGAGNAISDYAMGDPTLNAQKIAAYVGTGALFGAGLGGLGKLTESYLPAATSKLKDSLGKLQELATGTADQPGLIDKVAPDWAQKFRAGMSSGEIKPEAATRDLVTNLNDIVKNAKTAASDLYEKATPANMAEALKDMPVDQAKALAGQTISKIESSITGPEGSLLAPSSEKIVTDRLSKLSNKLESSNSAAEVHGALGDFASELNKGNLIKRDTMPTASQMNDQDLLKGILSTLKDDLRSEDMWGQAGMHYGELNQNYSAYKNSLRNFQSSFMKREIGANGSKQFVVDPKKVSSFFEHIDKVGQDLPKQYLNDFINQSQNLAKASENYAGYIKGAGAISDHVSDLASKNNALRNSAERLTKAGNSSSGLDLLHEGMVGAFAHTLGVPNPLIGAAIGASEAVKAIRNPYQAGAGLANVLNKLKGLGSVIEKTTNSIAAGSKGIFNSGVSGYTGGVLTDKAYDKHVQNIQMLANDPQKFSDHLEKTTSAIYEAAPNIVQGIQNTTVAGVQFLKSKIPQPTTELPLGQEWEPTKSQKAQFNRYFQAVNDPISLLKQIKDGSLSNEAMEAVKAVHPDLLKDMQQKVMENIDPKKAKSINYSTKIALSKFLGQPMDQSLLPGVIFGDQNVFNPATPQASTSSPKKRKSTLGGLKELSLAKRSATETQELEQDTD